MYTYTRNIKRKGKDKKKKIPKTKKREWYYRIWIEHNENKCRSDLIHGQVITPLENNSLGTLKTEMLKKQQLTKITKNGTWLELCSG